MAQITTGYHSVLSHPKIYDFFQDIMGAKNLRRKFVRDYIRPFSGCRILDIGCGTARILDFLPDDVTYHGFDMSQRYIDNAIHHYGKRGHFHCSLVNKAAVENLPPFDIIVATGLLHHLDDNQVYDLLKLTQSVLQDGGRLVSLDPCFADGQNSISRFLVSRDRGQNVRTNHAYYQLASTVFSKVNGEIRHQAWIPYTQWIMECSK